MKSIDDIVFEAAAKKPSGIVKSQNQLKKIKNEYIVGDIYDLSGNNRVTQEDEYVNTNANGYILDKEGNIYDVSASTEQGDAGRIAGGSTSYHVTIHKVDGEHDVSLRGYIAIFSTPRGEDIIDDIKAGYYLEDYLAKHEKDISTDKSIVKDIIAKGNKDAKSYTGAKSDKKQEKEAAFKERYVTPGSMEWSIEDGSIDLTIWSISSEVKELAKSIILPMVEKAVKETFKIALSDLNGVRGGVVFNAPAEKKETATYSVNIDTKKKNLVWMYSYTDYKKKNFPRKNEILKDVVELSLSTTLKFSTKEISDLMKGWIGKIYDKFQKDKKHEHGDWVKTRAEQIWKDGRGYYSWNPDKYTKGEAKRKAEEEWTKLIRSNNPFSQKFVEFDIHYLTDITNKIKPEKKVKAAAPDTELNNLPDESEEKLDVKPERGKNTELSKGAKKDAENKMDAWHNGTRKQNVKNLSDAKLKLNYSICKSKGYEEEMKQLEDEAKKRELTLEAKLSLIDYVTAINESIDF